MKEDPKSLGWTFASCRMEEPWSIIPSARATWYTKLGATAVQNTLLLHESADSISFVFEAATHTKGVTLKVEHPQLDGDDLQEVRLFPREDAEEDSGEDICFKKKI